MNDVRVGVRACVPPTWGHLRTEGVDSFVNVDFAERAGLPYPRLDFAPNDRHLTVRLPELAQQLEPRPEGVRLAFDILTHRRLLYQKPAAGLDELGDSLEDALWFRKLLAATRSAGPIGKDPHVGVHV